jgi:hypothetical protein
VRLTLRTLLAYLDDTLPAAEAKAIGEKVAESPSARELIDRIRKLTRKRGLAAPADGPTGGASDPNVVSDFLSDTLAPDEVALFEEACMQADVNLAEVASCHQILTLLMSEPVRVPPTARQRMYRLVKGPESLPNRKPGATLPIGGEPPERAPAESFDADATLLLGVPALAGADTKAKRAYPVLIGVALLAGMLVTGYLAWPKSQPESAALRATPPSTKPTGEAPPPQVAESPPKRDTAPAEAPDKRDAVPAEPAEKREEAPAPRAVKPGGNPPPLPNIPPLVRADPKTDRIAIGRHVNPTALLLARRPDRDDPPWLRTTVESDAVWTTDRLVAPAGYKATIDLVTGVRLDLWGNLPDQHAAPVLTASGTVHVPANGFAADLTVHAGRVYLATTRPTGARVRVRVPGNSWDAYDVWDVTLTDAGSDVAVEVRFPPRRGQNGTRPVAEVTVAVVRGSAAVWVGGRAFPRAEAGTEWDADNRGWFAGPRRAGSPETGRPADYFARPAAGKEPAAVAKALAAFGPMFTGRSGAKTAFAAAASSPPGDATTAGYLARSAVYWQAGADDLPAVVNALCDTNRRDFRLAAIQSLPEMLARSPAAPDEFITQLGRARLSRAQVETVATLLTGGSAPVDPFDPDGLDRLLAGLASDALPVRELAYWVLRPTSIRPRHGT